MSKMNVAYLRVSTEAQTEKYGLDVQKQKILDFCDKNGITIDRWYIDGGYSGSKLDRPEIQKLLDDAESGQIGTVYIYKLDRVSRDVIDTLNLLYRILPKYNIKVVSMVEDIKTENPIDKFIITINAAQNQYERDIMRMRMSAGMVERVRKGYWMGGGRIPWGYYYDRNDGILHPHPEHAEMVRQAYRLYLEGHSCDSIAKILGFKGEPIVIGILKRKSNIGLIEYKGEVYKGLHEPIIDEETFYQVQESMKKRSTGYIVHDNMLTGLCYCGICGARMRYQKWGKYHKLICYSQDRNGKEYMKRDPDCINKKVKAYEIEERVEGIFKRFIVNAKESVRESNVDFLETSIKKANAKIKKLYSFYIDNESDNILDLIKEEEERVAELKKQLEAEREQDKRLSFGRINEIKSVADRWDSLSNQDKNKLLKECVEKIVITGDDIDIHFVVF